MRHAALLRFATIVFLLLTAGATLAAPKSFPEKLQGVYFNPVSPSPPGTGEREPGSPSLPLAGEGWGEGASEGQTQ